MIIKCTCLHNYQDEKYGSGMRVMNATGKKRGEKVVHRCVVCQSEKVEGEK